MKLKNILIRKLLIYTAIGILLIIISIAAVTYFQIDRISRYNRLLSQVEKLKQAELQLSNIQKEYLLNETKNLTYYETGKSSLIDDFDSISRFVVSELNSLASNKVIKKLNLEKELNTSIGHYNIYRTDFDAVSGLIMEKGFKDFGLEGNLRTAIHEVEAKFKAMNRDELSVSMLMLRRHEKDYMLRKDLHYRDEFNAKITQLKAVIPTILEASIADEIINLLNVYQQQFLQLVEKDRVIGLNESSGLLAKLNQDARIMETGLMAISQQIAQYSKKAETNAVLSLFIILFVFTVFAVFILVRIALHIMRSIARIQNYITRLGAGELPERIEPTGKDEISLMVISINTLTENLKKTREFAIEVGNGNLEKEIDVFNNEGDLGGALIEMRKKLYQVAVEREKQEIEAKERNWVNEGLAAFAELVRHKTANLEEFGQVIIQNLVKYTNSNQAGLFLLNQDDSQDIFIELVAAYAYERKKYLQKRIDMNEGLVGMCVSEAETVYLTEIPDNYLNITSGLGGANPKSLLLIPLKVEEEVLGVIEIASFYSFKPYQIAFIEKVAESVAGTLQNVKVNLKTALLLNQTRLQAEELAAQEEELRQNMEELQTTQEAMVLHEQELHESLMDKDMEIKSLEERFEDEISILKAQLSTNDLLLNILDGGFILAQLDPSGDILSANDLYQKNLKMTSNNSQDSFFAAYIKTEEEVNSQEWLRLRTGESFFGFIHRLNPQDEPIELFAGFFPIFSADKRLKKIVFIAHSIRKIDHGSEKLIAGTWKSEMQIVKEQLN
jgi:GAF domain-containing protein